MTCQEAIDVMGEALEGRLAPKLRPGFDEHMGECRPCATYYSHLHVTRQALRALPPEDATNARRDGLLETYRREFERRDD